MECSLFFYKISLPTGIKKLSGCLGPRVIGFQELNGRYLMLNHLCSKDRISYVLV